MKIYLDVCCFNRPFDDHKQDRIKIESEAISRILMHCGKGIWDLVISEIVEAEIGNTRDQDKKQRVMELTTVACDKIEVNHKIQERAVLLESIGFQLFDALHIACAEQAKIDVFLTTDDGILKKSQRDGVDIKVQVYNPIIWLLEREVNNESRNDYE